MQGQSLSSCGYIPDLGNLYGETDGFLSIVLTAKTICRNVSVG